jgi:tRNA(Ile)-lysidine synthetase, N-terminal domain/tRNA(Ile)-lysidine synthetase, C-terminal domain
MIKEFQKYIEDNALFSKDDSILLAVSGGIDSMVMTDLFLNCGYNFAIAHCNFKLRGQESQRDEDFVTSFCQEHNIKLYKKSFDTFTYMKDKGKSLEMSARDLRYEYFFNLLKTEGYTYLATAHHADDSIETFFINLLRGTGISGLHGILQKVNNVIHPMIFTNRTEITAYQQEHSIAFVEDSTNVSVKFTRNKIRHELLPLIKEISPNFERTIVKEIERFRETEQVFRTLVNKAKEEIVIKEQDKVKIPIAKIKTLTPSRIYLYEFLSEYGFNESNINAIEEALDDISGKQFFSENYRLIKDREYLIIVENKQEKTDQYCIREDQTSITHPIKLHMELLKDLSFVRIPKTKFIAMLDYDKLTFPLTLRHWYKGDAFFPYGMRGEKKISDFYQNLKYSILDKENQWLLCSNDKIVWVVGQRIDDRFKITGATQTIYKIEIDG